MLRGCMTYFTPHLGKVAFDSCLNNVYDAIHQKCYQKHLIFNKVRRMRHNLRILVAYVHPPRCLEVRLLNLSYGPKNFSLAAVFWVSWL